MKKIIKLFVLVFVGTFALFLISCNGKQKENSISDVSQKELDSLRKQVNEMLAASKIVEENLIKFDTLDFKIFSRQDWQRFHESHDKNITVHFPDGHTTEGLDVHLKDMAAMFVYAPDTRIEVHPIRLGQGNLTAVTGIMEGTFTEPMPIGNNQFIKPTGKKFKIPMATFGIWKDGVMIEEYLYWDNKTYMEQMGIGK